MRAQLCLLGLAALNLSRVGLAGPIQAWWGDVDHLSVDELTVRSFQGVVNRNEPLLYVVQWKEDIQFDLTGIITGTGTCAFAIVSDNARSDTTLAGRESMTPPWLIQAE